MAVGSMVGCRKADKTVGSPTVLVEVKAAREFNPASAQMKQAVPLLFKSKVIVGGTGATRAKGEE